MLESHDDAELANVFNKTIWPRIPCICTESSRHQLNMEKSASKDTVEDHSYDHNEDLSDIFDLELEQFVEDR